MNKPIPLKLFLASASEDDSPSEPSPVIRRLLEELGSEKVRVRKAAEARLRDTGDEGLNGLIWLMRHETEAQKRRPHVEAAKTSCLFVTYCIIFSSVFLGRSHPMPLARITAIVAVSTVLSSITSAARSRWRHRTAVDLLVTHYTDVRIIGPLVEALHFGHAPTRRTAEDALIRLLPLLRPEHGELVSPKQRVELCSALGVRKTELTLAILTALKQIGDGDAIPYVKRVATRRGYSEPIVQARQLAEECLVVLRQRVEEEQNPKIVATCYHKVRCIGPLAQVLHHGHKRTQPAVEKTLVRLLPLLTPEHGDLVSPKQRVDLCRALGGRNEELTLAILAALEQIGDGIAIPYVERITARRGNSEPTVRARQLAEECLVILRQRAEEAQNPKILLRASDAPPIRAETLLRAAGSGREEDATQMLRASQRAED